MDTERHGRTLRLELDDPALRHWETVVLAADPERGIVLERSAFYPGGGGQPADHGALIWDGGTTAITTTHKDEDLWLVPAADAPWPPVGVTVRATLDDERRTALMRTHTALHLLSAVVYRDFGAKVTGGNMEPGAARMDFNLPTVPDDFRQTVVAACATEIAADRAVTSTRLPRQEAFDRYPELIRTATNLLPDHLTVVRIVDIAGLDTQADGGTHVASTGLVGGLEIVKMESKGKGNRRLRLRLTDG